MERRWLRAGAIAGVVFAVAQIVAGVLPGTPPALTASGESIAGYVADHRGAYLLAGIISALAAPAFLVVVGALWRLGSRRSSTTPLLAIFALSAAIATAVSLGGSAGMLTLAWLAAEPLEPAIAQALYVLLTMAFLLIGAAVIAMAPSAALLLRQGGLAGTGFVWMGWVVAAVMLASLFAPLADDGLLKPGSALVLARDYPFAIWLFWLCWALWRAARLPATEHAEAAASVATNMRGMEPLAGPR